VWCYLPHLHYSLVVYYPLPVRSYIVDWLFTFIVVIYVNVSRGVVDSLISFTLICIYVCCVAYIAFCCSTTLLPTTCLRLRSWFDLHGRCRYFVHYVRCLDLRLFLVPGYLITIYYVVVCLVVLDSSLLTLVLFLRYVRAVAWLHCLRSYILFRYLFRLLLRCVVLYVVAHLLHTLLYALQLLHLRLRFPLFTVAVDYTFVTHLLRTLLYAIWVTTFTHLRCLRLRTTIAYLPFWFIWFCCYVWFLPATRSLRFSCTALRLFCRCSLPVLIPRLLQRYIWFRCCSCLLIVVVVGCWLPFIRRYRYCRLLLLIFNCCHTFIYRYPFVVLTLHSV